MSAEKAEFQVITFFKEFQKCVAKANAYPVCSDNVIVHQDLIKLLGDDVEFFYPFASLAMDRPRSFNDLLFSVDLFHSSFYISIDQQHPIEFPYGALQLSEVDLARQLANLLIAIANGQVFLLATHIDDEGQAVEFLYKQKGAELYTVSRTFTFFTKASKRPYAAYGTTVRRNNADIPEVSVNNTFLGQVLPQTVAEESTNRRPFNDLNSPLTREEVKKRNNEATELWSQNWTAKWFPGQKHKATKADVAVSYTYYRYVEVVAVVLITLLVITVHERSVLETVLRSAVVAIGAVMAGLYMRGTGGLKPFLGVMAYVAAILYVLWFTEMPLDATWKWIVAILAFEPILEMIIADIYLLVKKIRNR